MHSIHRVVPCAALAALALLSIQTASAQGLSVGVSVGSYAYEVESSAQQVWSGKSNAYTLSTDYGFGEGTYVGLALTKVAEGTLDFTFQGNPLATPKFKRQDVALTVGHAFGSGINFFVGYKSAQTDIANGVDTKFKTAGPFLGIADTFSWGSNSLALSGALGFKTGTWSDTGVNLEDKAVGFSYGVRYAYSFTPKVLVGVGFKWQAYLYDFTAGGFGTVDETVKVLDLSLSYSF
jgi:hypothetical protein